MASGTVHSVTFTPDTAGDVIVTCTFAAQKTTGGDWGSSVLSRPFLTQNSSTSYGDGNQMSTTRGGQSVRHIFAVNANQEVVAGLYGELSGAVAASWWDIKVTAHMVKR